MNIPGIGKIEEERERFRDAKARLMKIQYLFPFFQLGLMKINYAPPSINPGSSLLRGLLPFFSPASVPPLYSFV